MSVFGSNLSRAGTKLSQDATPIDLKDNTKPAFQESNVDGGQANNGDDSLLASGVSRTATRSTLRQQLAARKYKKYSRERYGGNDTDEDVALNSPTDSSLQLKGTNTASTTGSSLQPGTGTKDVKVRRGQEKARALFKTRTRVQKKKEGDEEIEMLYENQRGSFFFGMPLYSSASLLNFDPPAWTTADGAPSPVDISNAQLPDPHWEWSWRSWYVDMSHDVDEQGWQYSFMFQKRFPWHGSHPWLYSFVRRRRWIRKRARVHKHQRADVEGMQSMKDAHKLNSDYFTIHPAKNPSPESSYAGSVIADGSMAISNHGHDEDEDPEEIETLEALFKRLKQATVDREKVNAVLDFMDHGGQQVYYLADEMERIMSMFLFQHTRKQLLTRMSRKIEAASAHRDEHEKHEEPEQENEKVGIDNLLRAIKTADEQIQKLEYWSDIKDMVREGRSFTATGEESGWEHDWRGLDKSGPGQLQQPLEKAGMEGMTAAVEKEQDDAARDKGKAKA